MIERRVGLRGEQPRELEHGGGARRVVVGAVSDRVARLGIERAVGRRAQVIEVRADDDVLIAQRGVAAGKNANTFCVGNFGDCAGVRDRAGDEFL